MERLIKGLHEFQTNYFTIHKEMFDRLSLGQSPRILFITCCDSRYSPNLITQTKPGELFITRNIGNIIPPYGATNGSEGAVIEYSVMALGIKDIIICGHSDCGAMKGLLNIGNLTEKMPLVYNWLRHAEATRQVINENYKHYEGEELLNITIKENILTQIENLRTYPVIRSKLHAGAIKIHAWFYQLETGEVFAYNPMEGEFLRLVDSLGESFKDSPVDKNTL